MMASSNIFVPLHYELELSERENAILRTIIHTYILEANPVGSRRLAKSLETELNLSSATIRNVMADLEDMELISHPHTSAGRVPTDKGYRVYVDMLMQSEALSDKELLAVKKHLEPGVAEKVLKSASKVLGMLSRCLGIALIPQISVLKVQKIELIQLASTRLLVVVALDSDIVKTVSMEAEFEIEKDYIKSISSYINEKTSGKPLRFIKENFTELLEGFDRKDTPLIRLVIESINQIFTSGEPSDKLHIAGTQNLLSYPEFDDLDRVRGVVELIENEDIIVHILEKYEESGGVKILIGTEMQNPLLDDYSLIVSNYQIGSAMGSIGLIGPKRMKYSKMISLVNYVSGIVSES